MTQEPDIDRAEIDDIVSVLRGVIARLDALGRTIEGSHLTAVVDRLSSQP